MRTKKGFTALELVIAICFVGAAVVFFFMQKATLDAYARDDHNKTAINSIYYALEDVQHFTFGYYPEVLTEEALRGADPRFLVDSAGNFVNSVGSSLHYEPESCNDGKCSSYVLRATLEKETDFIRRSRN
ncbi:type II secretion system GspH family protein [Candidatus Saccharibacteria bacterium]|nr:type II secretion system GspH family protein [Candidatus Saccharibacteria bacterium]